VKAVGTVTVETEWYTRARWALDAAWVASANPCEFCVIGDAWHYHSPGCPIGTAIGHLSDDDQERVNVERKAAFERLGYL
jgi:hypothetical protein